MARRRRGAGRGRRARDLAGELDLLEDEAGRRGLQLGLLHDCAGRQLGGVAAGLTLIVAVVIALVVVALAVVTGAVVVAALVVAVAVVAATVVGRARRGCGRRRRHRGVVALDLRVGVDRAFDVVAVEEVDGEGASRERDALTGLLLAVLDAVVVGVGVARVVARHELGLVAQAVVVLVALGLVDLQAQVMGTLPAVGDPIPVAVAMAARETRSGKGEHRGEGAGEEQQGADSSLAHAPGDTRGRRVSRSRSI